MKRWFTLIILAALVLGLVVLGIAETPTSVADTEAPDDEELISKVVEIGDAITSSLSEASDSSATACIAITMYTESDE